MNFEDVDMLAPEHQRTSCSDDDLNGNQHSNEFGYVRCVRCALLYRVLTGEFPYGKQAEIPSLLLKPYGIGPIETEDTK